MPIMTTTFTFGSRLVLHRLRTGLAAALAVVTISGCGTQDAADSLGPTQPFGRVRFVNLIVDNARNPVNPILEGLPFGAGVQYGVAVPAALAAPNTGIYAPIYVGNRTLVLRRTADTSVTLASIPFAVTADQDRTIYATGGAGGGAVTNFITTDDNQAPASGQVRVRVVHLSPAAGSVDIFVTTTTADLTLATPTLTAVAPTTASAYLSVAPGTYRVRVVPAGTAPAARPAAVALDVNNLTFPANGARTIIAADGTVGAGTAVRGFVLTDR
jgi:hypothetical protein